MPMAAYATPANQSGNCWSNSSGTIVLLSVVPSFAPGNGVTSAAIAM